MVTKVKNDFCFCTLALGKKYRSLATLLAQDLEKYSPSTSFIVLTDLPQHFSSNKNVLAFQHKQQGVYPYHDKRFVLAKALSLFNCCIFIDADMRILGEVSPNIEWLPGITARSGCPIKKHNENRFKYLSVINKIADKLGLQTEQVQFVNEFLFTIKKDEEKESEFITQWDLIAPYFELQGIHDGEGNAIGLAAAKAGMPVRFDSIDRFPFFKDRIEQVRINKGEVDKNEKLLYFEQQRMIEYAQNPLLLKVLNKINKNVIYIYRSWRLKLTALKNIDFYYR